MLFTQVSSYISGNFLQQALGIATSFVTRKFVAPSDFGLWVTITMILKYCQYSNLGIFSAIYKELPYYIGKHNTHKVNQIKNLSGTFIVAISCVVGIILFLVSLLPHLSASLKVAIRIASVMFMLTLVYNFFVTLFRAYNDFVMLSKVIVVNSILICILYITLSSLWGLPGLYAAGIISLAGSIVYILVMKGEFVSFKFVSSIREFREIIFLFKIGIVLIVVGFFYTIFLTVDKWIIIKYLGLKELGYYSIAMMFFEGIAQIPLLVGHVTFSKIQNLYGEMGNSAQFGTSVQKYLSQLTLQLTYVLPLVMGIIYIWSKIIITGFLPKYVPGLPSMYILLVGAFFLGISHFSNNFLLTLNKYVYSIPLYIVAITAAAVTAFMLLKRGLGLEGVACGATTGYVLFFIMVSWVALRNINTPTEIFLMYLKIFLILVYFGCVLFLCGKIQTQNSVYGAFLQTGLFALGGLPFLMKFNKATGLLAKITKKSKRGTYQG